MSSSTVSKLAELSGLTGAKRALLRIADPNHGVHAVLFYGAEGSGKNQLARALTQAWLCTNLGADGACGVCKSCEAFARDRSPDVLRVEPRGPSEIIKQNAVHELNPDPDPDPPLPLIEFFRTMPLSARNKVAIISRADRMNKSAANAFLKTLEEPHPRARIVMTTSDIGLVLPTIVSRCVCIACELPDEDQVREQAPNALPDLIELAEGAPGRLAHILKHQAAYTKVVQFSKKLSALSTQRSALSAAAALALSEQFRDICDDLQDTLKVGARAANVEGLRALGAAISSMTDCDDWFLAIAEAHRRVLGNGNAGMAFDAMFTKMLL